MVYEMTDEESAAHFANYKLKPSQLAGLLMDDPLRVWFNFEKGQLIRLTPRDQLNQPLYCVVGNEK